MTNLQKIVIDAKDAMNNLENAIDLLVSEDICNPIYTVEQIDYIIDCMKTLRSCYVVEES